MAYPERREIQQALLERLAEARGEIDVKEDRLFDLLADGFGLTDEERSRTYESGVQRWVQLVRVARQEMVAAGLFRTQTLDGRPLAKNVWALSEKGIEQGNAVLANRSLAGGSDKPAGLELPVALAAAEARVADESAPAAVALLTGPAPRTTITLDPPVSFREGPPAAGTDSPARTAEQVVREPDIPAPAACNGAADEGPLAAGPTFDAAEVDRILRSLGFLTAPRGERGCHVRSPIEGLPFEAEVVCVGGPYGFGFRTPSGPLLLVAADVSIATCLIAPAEAMVVAWRDLLGISAAHSIAPLSLDEAVELFQGTAADRGAGLRAWIENRPSPASAPGVDVAAQVLLHAGDRRDAGEHAPVTEEQVFWALFGNPGTRGRYDRASVAAAVAWLASPAIGALRAVEGGYIQVLSPTGLAARLRHIGAAFDGMLSVAGT